jgi:hypothetical protein
MSTIQPPFPVKLIIGIITSIPETLPRAEDKLSELFGPVDARSERFSFEWTRYYEKEMGRPLYRCFLSFADLIDPSTIAAVKAATNELEATIAGEYSGPRRPINLDPGYLEQSKLVLASTKNYYHRILVSEGIYAEVTLHFKEGRWHPFPWTFPDYGSGTYHPFFSTLRARYREQLSAAGYRIRLPGIPGRRKKQ